MSSSRPLPWYRQFWPVFLLSLPLTVVVAGITTAYIAFKDADGVVVDDYYKEGLAINETLDRDRKASELGLSADVRLHDGLLEVRLSGKDNPAALRVHLEHPTRANRDHDFLLSRDASGVYKQAVDSIPANLWYITITPIPDVWRLTGEWHLQDSNALTLASRPLR